MNKKNAITKSLRSEFLALLVISFTIYAGLFFLLNELVGMKLSTYLNSPAYLEEQAAHTAESLQSYLTEHQVSIDDDTALENWVREQRIVTLIVNHNGLTLFDSSGHLNLTNDYYSPEELSSYFSEQTLSFSDDTASVYITGIFGFHLYTWATLLIFVLCILLFLTSNVVFIKKKILYLEEITDGIHILEGGTLNYSIPISGHDELARLATSLNHMSQSLKEQIAAESEARDANHQLITALSHDLRTPLTTGMGYLEIMKELLKKPELSPEATDSLNTYLDKCLGSCTQLKHMSDSLFEYFLVTSPEEYDPKQESDIYQGPEIFLQLLAEKTMYLEEKGFQFQYTVSEKTYDIRLNLGYMMRILDNLLSNIEKYALPQAPVQIHLYTNETHCMLYIGNEIRHDLSNIESNKIGTRSVAAMMKKMGGTCAFRKEEQDDGDAVFHAELSFPLC